MTRRSRSQITPEPELPIEPRTSTTLRAISRASSARASEICSAPIKTSVVICVRLDPLVRPRGWDYANLAQVAATNELDTCRSADRVRAERHLQCLTILDRAAADGEHDVAGEQPAALGGCARLEAQQHEAYRLFHSQPRAQHLLNFDRLGAHAKVGAAQRLAADDALNDRVNAAGRDADRVATGQVGAEHAHDPPLDVCQSAA